MALSLELTSPTFNHTQAYLVRLELRDIYQRTLKPARARYRLESWIH